MPDSKKDLTARAIGLYERLETLEAQACGKHKTILAVLDILDDTSLETIFDEVLETLLQEGRYMV